MNRYHFRVWVGPTGVAQAALQMRQAAAPWQRVTIEGTEHVHFSIEALHDTAAHTECDQWLSRAALACFRNSYNLLRKEVAA